ncbi:MAG: methionyl-tRNA formyltransferase [Synergistaceae bacterium]|nr:methionyl-tRNA formyltransferase [Synergistaceae bacterium]
MYWLIGTGQFAAMCLEGLNKRGFEFSKIITGLPTKSGRGNKEIPSPVEIKANSLGLEITRTGRLANNSELISELERENPKIIFVIDFGQLIKEPFLSHMCINIHPSLLPEYRGAAPIQRALLDNKTKTGVTLFRLVKEMDAGEILAQSGKIILPEYNASDLYKILAETGCDLAGENINNLVFTPQNENLATYANKLDKGEFILSFNMSAKKFYNTVRALDMSGGAYIFVRGKRVKIWRCELINNLSDSEPGKILDLSESIIISCADKAVSLLEVQSEGRKICTGLEWARGMRLKAGEIL